MNVFRQLSNAECHPLGHHNTLEPGRMSSAPSTQVPMSQPTLTRHRGSRSLPCRRRKCNLLHGQQHFVLISNSHEGTMNGELYDRIGKDDYGEFGDPWPHEVDHCEEYEAHLPKAPEPNFASIVMRFFGEHDQRPFEPSPKTGGYSDEDRHRHVGKKMAGARFGGRALGQCWQSGTGEHPRLYRFKHAYSELPFVVGHQASGVGSHGGRGQASAD